MSEGAILNLIGYPSLAASIAVFVSVLRLHGHAWKEAGQRRWLWGLLSVVSFPVLLGLPLAFVYFVWARPDVLSADAACIATRVAARNVRRQQSRQQASRSAQRLSTTTSASAPGFAPFAPTKRPCTACSDGRQLCWTCNGSRSAPQYDGTFSLCTHCSGGYVQCTTCGGSGYL